MSDLLTQFDEWLQPAGPVAMTVRTHLEPVMGSQSVLFPPTFAPSQDEKKAAPDYIIDGSGADQTALVDTVGSQANRLEPIFKKPPYAALVPQVQVQIGDRVVKVNLLDAGHRAADAVIRFSSKRDAVAKAFAAVAERGDATPLAKLAPTSLVFGVWDSRGLNVKLPRLIGATIRAYGVEKLTRGAQFFSSFEKDETEALDLPQDTLSGLGLSDAPAGRGPGGIIARRGIRREAILNLIALRALGGADEESTRLLQRYILGLALVAMTAPVELFLREGCLLVPSTEIPGETLLVRRTGERAPFTLGSEEALAYAQAAAAAFGVGENWEAEFEKDSVKATADKKKPAKKKPAEK
jgi:CRISPR-associated protein Csb1